MVASGTRKARAISGGREAPEQAQGQGDPGLGGEHRVAGGEHEAQQIVADVVVECAGEIRLGALLPRFELRPEHFVFALEQLVAAQAVDRPVLRRGHEPGARVVRDARLGPSFECGH